MLVARRRVRAICFARAGACVRTDRWCEGEFAVGVAGDLFAVLVDAYLVASPAE